MKGAGVMKQVQENVLVLGRVHCEREEASTIVKRRAACFVVALVYSTRRWTQLSLLGSLDHVFE